MKDILSYKVCPLSFLFSRDGLVSKSKKSELLTAIEKELIPEGAIMQISHIDCRTAHIIDVMAIARKIQVGQQTTFGDLIKSIHNFILNLSKGFTTKRIDFVFDSYFEGSLKDSERQRRITERPI